MADIDTDNTSGANGANGANNAKKAKNANNGGLSFALVWCWRVGMVAAEIRKSPE